MTDVIVRIIELVTGTLLIVLTLLFSSYFDSQGMLLLPLIALPIIFSGMFDWHPVKKLGLMLKTLGTHVRLPDFIKPHIHSP